MKDGADKIKNKMDNIKNRTSNHHCQVLKRGHEKNQIEAETTSEKDTERRKAGKKAERQNEGRTERQCVGGVNQRLRGCVCVCVSGSISGLHQRPLVFFSTNTHFDRSAATARREENLCVCVCL